MNKFDSKIKIGVIGSYKDTYFDDKLTGIAYSVGKLIAENNAILVVGPEPSKDLNSGVIAASAAGAKSAGGLVVGILPRFFNDYFPKNIDVTIFSGGEIGGIREIVLVSSCDVIISICGGAGTLCEMALAYHNQIPVIALKNTGGISEKYAGQYLDYRKEIHEPIFTASTVQQALKKAFELGQKYRNKKGKK